MKSAFDVLPEQASSLAGELDALYLFILWFSILGTIFVAVMTLYFSIKYRRRSEDELPEQPVESEKGGVVTSMIRVGASEDVESSVLEVATSIGLFICVMVMFGWGAHLYIRMNNAPKDAMEILATGKQWMWKLQHPTGKREINDLHLPLGQPVKVTMTSEDVIHSFYIPAFRVKADAVPGRYSQVWFTPTKAGVYNLFCAEYCGTEHSRMGGLVYVLKPEEYQKWLAGVTGGPQLPPEEAGAKLFVAKGCQVCHSGLPGALGPKLNGLFGAKTKLLDGSEVTADEDYLHESILNSFAKIKAGYAPVMPLFKGQLSEEEVMQLIAYIKSLKGEAGTK